MFTTNEISHFVYVQVHKAMPGYHWSTRLLGNRAGKGWRDYWKGRYRAELRRHPLATWTGCANRAIFPKQRNRKTKPLTRVAQTLSKRDTAGWEWSTRSFTSSVNVSAWKKLHPFERICIWRHELQECWQNSQRQWVGVSVCKFLAPPGQQTLERSLQSRPCGNLAFFSDPIIELCPARDNFKVSCKSVVNSRALFLNYCPYLKKGNIKYTGPLTQSLRRKISSHSLSHTWLLVFLSNWID